MGEENMGKKNNEQLIPPGRSASGKSCPAGNRRRGDALEAAILKAAWDELSDTGYSGLTMEGVAARAGTNKAVLYRRWPNKTGLVIAALKKYLPKRTNDIPDTGELRSDVFAYLQGLVQPLHTIGTKTIRGLLSEYFSKDGRQLIALIPQIMHPRAESRSAQAMAAILKNAGTRGEVCPEKLTTRIISLPLDLLKYEILTTQEPVSDETIAEIVDDIFMPLVRCDIPPI